MILLHSYMIKGITVIQRVILQLYYVYLQTEQFPTLSIKQFANLPYYSKNPGTSYDIHIGQHTPLHAPIPSLQYLSNFPTPPFPRLLRTRGIDT